jgi:phage-related minor tail protein
MSMPGFRTVPENITGVAADCARKATALEETGDRSGAITLYECALTESLAERPQMPGFVCGRLAAVYRRERRYQDELDLLERYRDSQTDEDARTRFDARLSKARALTEKHARTDSAALASVRAIKPSPRRAPRG